MKMDIKNNISRKIASDIWNTKVDPKIPFDKYLDEWERMIDDYATKMCKNQKKQAFKFICINSEDQLLPPQDMGLFIQECLKQAPLPDELRRKRKRIEDEQRTDHQ
jgi:hypothetical protein